MVLNSSNHVFIKDNAVDITLRDINLERLYNVLFVYFELFDDYSFDILRKPKFYELKFKAWGVPKRGGN